MKGKIAAFLLLASLVHSATVRLENDTAYPLKAVVQGADGSTLCDVLLNPQETKTWSDSGDFSAKKKPPSKSVTPFTVHWYCKSGESFSISDHISTGSLVRAMDGIGSKTYPSKKEENKD